MVLWGKGGIWVENWESVTDNVKRKAEKAGFGCLVAIQTTWANLFKMMHIFMLGFISSNFIVDVWRHLFCQEKEGGTSQAQITFDYMDIQNTLEAVVSCSFLLLSIDYCRVGWEIVQIKTLQISAVWQEESRSVCGWITHHVPMKVF